MNKDTIEFHSPFSHGLIFRCSALFKLYLSPFYTRIQTIHYILTHDQWLFRSIFTQILQKLYEIESKKSPLRLFLCSFFFFFIYIPVPTLSFRFYILLYWFHGLSFTISSTSSLSLSRTFSFLVMLVINFHHSKHFFFFLVIFSLS